MPTSYSNEFREAILRRVLPPNSEPLSKVSKDEGVSVQTLRKWLREADALPPVSNDPENWSSAEKFRIVIETAAMNEIELSEYARSKGLYVEQIATWRDNCINANGNVAIETLELTRKLKSAEKKNKEYEKEIQRKDKALAEVTALAVLRKKADAIWGDAEEG